MYRIRTRAMHLKRREGPGNEVVRQQNVEALSRVACVADRLNPRLEFFVLVSSDKSCCMQRRQKKGTIARSRDFTVPYVSQRSNE